MFSQDLTKKLVDPSGRRNIKDVLRVSLILFIVCAYCGVYLFKVTFNQLSVRIG